MEHHVNPVGLAAAEGGEPSMAVKARGVPFDAFGDRGIGGEDRPADLLHQRLEWTRQPGDQRFHPGVSSCSRRRPAALPTRVLPAPWSSLPMAWSGLNAF